MALSFLMGSSGTAHIENYQNVGKPVRVVSYPHRVAGIFAGYSDKSDIYLVNAYIAWKGECLCAITAVADREGIRCRRAA